MKQEYIDRLMNGRTAGEDFEDFLRKLPDELDVYLSLLDIFDKAEEEGADWVTRQFQQIAKRYLSDDAELMQMIKDDEDYMKMIGEIEDEKNSSARQ